MAMLSKAQWLKGPKKSGTYAAYVKWYNKYVALPKNPLAPWTPRQQAAETSRRVEDIIRPLRQQAERERGIKVASINAAAQASNKILQSKVGQVQGAYDLGIKELQGVGGGYSAAMQARIKGAQDAAAQFASSQGATATPGVDAQALADTAYHTGVGIPAAGLASEGAAQTALEATQAGAPLLQGQADVVTANQEYENQLLELAQQRPELADKIAQQLFENELAKIDARIKQQAQDTLSGQFGETVRHHLVGERQAAQRNRLSRLRYDLQVKSHQDALDKAAGEGRLPNASLSRAYGYIVDKQGHPILDKNGKKIPVAKSSTAKSSKAKAQAQYGKAVGEAEKMFRVAHPGTDEFGEPIKPKRLWRWGVALRYLMNRYGIQRRAARKALIAAGFKPPPGSQYEGSTSPSGNPGGTAGATPNYGGRGGQ